MLAQADVKRYGKAEMCPSPDLPPKKAVALALLRGPSLLVHLDPRKPEVVVPPDFKQQSQLVLQVGLNLAIPIRDLEVTDEAISGTLSFSRTPFWCFVPWAAVFALAGEDGRGLVWPEDVPPELAVAPEHAAAERAPRRPAAKRPRGRPGTRRRKLPAEEPAAPQAPEPTEPLAKAGAGPADGKAARKLPPYLRVVK